MAYNRENHKYNLPHFREPCDILSTICNNFYKQLYYILEIEQEPQIYPSVNH